MNAEEITAATSSMMHTTCVLQWRGFDLCRLHDVSAACLPQIPIARLDEKAIPEDWVETSLTAWKFLASTDCHRTFLAPLLFWQSRSHQLVAEIFFQYASELMSLLHSNEIPL